MHLYLESHLGKCKCARYTLSNILISKCSKGFLAPSLTLHHQLRTSNSAMQRRHGCRRRPVLICGVLRPVSAQVHVPRLRMAVRGRAHLQTPLVPCSGYEQCCRCLSGRPNRRRYTTCGIWPNSDGYVRARISRGSPWYRT